MKTLMLFLLLLSAQSKQNSILFIGDSMTSYDKGWHHQLAKKLDVSYTNLSVPGKRTAWMLQTLKSNISSNSYKTCFIYGGINDGFSYVNTQSTINNLQAMIDLCNANGIKPVVVVGYNPLLVMTNLNIKNPDFHRNRYIEIQNLMVQQLRNCKIIKMDTSITRSDTDDGIHFKASGHRKFSQWVLNNYSK